MSRYVDLSEKVTATFYDEQYEEWTEQTVTIADVLDSVCDDYTVLPSAQPTQTNTSNTLKSLDCIDRQDAIDVIAKTYVIHGSAGSWIDHALGALRGLPSAQPETEEQMPETEQNVLNDELISKKEAIDLFLAKGMPTAAVYIERMPSVQPEIIRCRECKHYDGRPCGIVDWYNTADDFCSRAERRHE